MKKYLLIIAFGTFFFSNAQKNFCLTDQVQKEQETKDPSLKEKREANEAKLRSVDSRKFLKSKGATVEANGKYTGTIYTIPVVVHIIVPNNEAIGTQFNPSDAQVQTWIDNTNNILATTYGGTIFPEGTGPNAGTVMPFQLVLAKRTETCNATTGIERYYPTTAELPNYSANGVRDTGVTASQITAFAPHWKESSYYNIYIVNTIGDGGTGFAGFPFSSDSGYHAFMTYKVATSTDFFNIGIFPHELGHSIGLIHTFEGSDPNATVKVCPVNNDCTTDNDKVCDTSPNTAYLNPLPDNTIINPCTGSNYDGIQYNMMSYNQNSKFTPGQRDRALLQFLTNRENLTKSLGATPLADNSGGGTLKATTCIIVDPITSFNYAEGPKLVSLGSINNTSESRSVSNHKFYIDYSSQNCINPSVYTDLTVAQTYTLQVSIEVNSQYIQAWIDYDNSGTFEASELVANSVTKVPKNTTWAANIIPPATAILNTPLRFRVRASEETGACTTPAYGQVEDYKVTLKPSTILSTNEQKADSKFVIGYSKNDNKLISNKTIGNYKIYDMSGKLIQKGTNNSKEVNLTFSQSGVYIIVVNSYSIKFNK
ncbi:M43 family zinc metalloprotease [Flavobacterium sp. Fl-77]|uniref:M43 family zinc metalloprotease n=1 Tax=Flavobacterium flavipigmentatum TaxID=2893884 RepID=A0AAJ2VY02_9FLAO|nr:MULTISPECIES: M43 family zinc metalloprotease [unclassified Flavobacterium]MDX6183819.1 M43 family zinc metalloprotease [Flavobacterium sp. Fl-33]MDX6187437.1 M43 family zinc metalloprotease [Flavobacterium sp. Fl-77]UFH40339.1 zinc-dependent metalloprotease [Flavobacterium sp. F-70]